MISPGTVTVLVAVMVIAWLGFARQRRVPVTGGRPVARRRWAGVGLLLLALLSTTTTAAAGVNASFAYLPRVGDVATLVDGKGPWPVLTWADLARPDPGAHPRGGVLTLPVPDDGTGLGASSALVWLPPQYLREPTRRFPVLYLLHGSPGVPQDWLRGGRLADTAEALAARGLPAIVVVPRVSRGWLDDPECVDGVHERVETHLLRTVVPLVDARLRTRASRDGRAIGGMSAGGYCALNLGLKHRNDFGTVLDLSGLTAPTHLGGLSRLYGPDTSRAAADTPLTYATALPKEPGMRVWLDVGRSDDEVRPGIEALAPVLTGRGFDVVLRVRPGRHTFDVWRPALAEAMAWALPAMETSTTGTGPGVAS